MKEQSSTLASVAFRRRNCTYQGSIPLGDLALLRDDPGETMRAVTNIYGRALQEIRSWQRDVKVMRRSKAVLSARKAWELGDIVFRLDDALAQYSCKLEDMYGHLSQHAKTVKGLGRYVSFRRYLNDVNMIPERLEWHSVEKKPKTAAQAIAAGLHAGSG